jgi:hypothetical protein
MQLLGSLRRRHRTMAANPVIRLGGNRAQPHTGHGARSTKKRPAEPHSCLREPSDHCQTFCGPTEIAGSAHRAFGFMPPRSHEPEYLEWTRPRPFPKPLVKEWSPLHKITTITSLCVSVRFEKAYCWCFKKIANFFLSYSLLCWIGQQSSSGFSDLAPLILHYNWF